MARAGDTNIQTPLIINWNVKCEIKTIRNIRMYDKSTNNDSLYVHWHKRQTRIEMNTLNMRIPFDKNLIIIRIVLHTWTDVKPRQMTICERGLMNDGRLADCLPCLKIRDIRFVFVRRAAYTTVKQKPAPNLLRQKKGN